MVSSHVWGQQLRAGLEEASGAWSREPGRRAARSGALSVGAPRPSLSIYDRPPGLPVGS